MSRYASTDPNFDPHLFEVQDQLIRRGKCPNGHGPMSIDFTLDTQTCPVCHFTTNVAPSLKRKQ